MDWPTFISNMTGALAWPVVVGGIAFFYRVELRHLASSMKKFKVGPLEAEMYELKARQARLAADALPPHNHAALPGPGASDSGTQPQPPEIISEAPNPGIDDRLIEMLAEASASGSRRLVVQDIWTMVEDAVRSLAERSGSNPRSSVVMLLLDLTRRKVMSSAEYEVVRNLYTLRSELAGTTVTPSEETVVEYAAAASSILRKVGVSEHPGRSAALRSVPLGVTRD